MKGEYRPISLYYFNVLEDLKKEVTVNNLSSFEFAFLENLWGRAETYGRSMNFTEKQQEVLRNISRKFDDIR